MDKPESNFFKAFDKINDYALGSFALMFSLSVTGAVIDKIAGPGSDASVALEALEKVSAIVFVGTSSVLLTGAAAFVAAGSVYMLVKASLAVKELAQDMHKGYTEQKAADATQLNTDVQNELKQLSAQTNGDPIKTLEVAKFRLSVAIVDGDGHKQAIYTEVNKRLTAEPEDIATAVAYTGLAIR